MVVRSGRWYYPVEYVVQANSLRLGKKRTQLENGIHAVARDVPAAAARGVDVVEARFGRQLLHGFRNRFAAVTINNGVHIHMRREELS